jgi:hypothetical protein
MIWVLLLLLTTVSAMETVNLRHTANSTFKSVGYTGEGPVGPPMFYHGGLVMGSSKPPKTVAITIHTILYGSRLFSHSMLDGYYAGLGTSQWFKSTLSYLPRGTLLKTVKGGVYIDASYSRGKAIKRTLMIDIIRSAIATGKMGKPSPTSMYAFIFDSSVSFSGMCSAWCGWHDFYAIDGVPTYVMVMGSPAGCPAACSVLKSDGSDSPNGNFIFDSIINILSHEISEVITDPEFTAYYDSKGDENADKCAWRYGNVFRTSSKRLFNQKIGKANYLVQQNWDFNKKRCV